MATCDVCGNDYDKTLHVTQNGRSMTFDSFECAISAMAPVCSHCNCRIMGHGVEQGGTLYLRPLRKKQGSNRGSRPRVIRSGETANLVTHQLVLGSSLILRDTAGGEPGNSEALFIPEDHK